MLIASVVCMLVACVALAVGNCFVKQNKIFSYVLKTLMLIALICLSITCATCKNNFSGFVILLIISITPLFLNIYEFKQENNKNVEEIEETIETETEKPQKKVKKSRNLPVNWQKCLTGISYSLSAFCVAFCGLYLGKETAFGFLLGIAIALFLTFLDAIIHKNKKYESFMHGFVDYLQNFIMFIGIGLLLGQIIPVLLYSTQIKNIMFCLGCLAYSTHIFLTIYLKSKFDHLAQIVAFFLLISTILF